MATNSGGAARVGLTVLIALVVLAVGVLVIGDQSLLFTTTDDYFVKFRNVGGLAERSSVQLNGVNVGRVERIVLSEDSKAELIEVHIAVERRFAARIRADSVARIKSLGLLGDKYVEITSGSPAYDPVTPGAEIPAAQPTDVDALIESGEDVVDHVVSTARSLSVILGRMERGEGVLGELVTEQRERSVTEALLSTLASVERVANRIDSGEGLVGRLIQDEQLGDETLSVVTRLGETLERIETGDGLLPALINDESLVQTFRTTLEDTSGSLEHLEQLMAKLEDGDGLLPRLINDDELGTEVTQQLRDLLGRLNQVTEELQEGDGTAARLISDPAIYEALNDIVVGINESKFLRWLIRNRQKAGIKKRYEDQQEQSPDPG